MTNPVYLRGHHLDLIRNLMDYHKSSEVIFSDTEVVLRNPRHTPLVIATKETTLKHQKATVDGLKLAQRLLDNPSLNVELVDSVDDVCRLCPHEGNDECESEKYVREDKKAASFYGLEVGKRYKSGFVIDQIVATIRRYEKLAAGISR